MHFQRLSMSFHERYTSGRVDLAPDLRHRSDRRRCSADGVVTLVTSVLLIVGIGVALLLLDLQLAIAVLGVVPDPVDPDALVPQPLRACIPRHARRGRARDRALRREPRRHPGGARVPPRAAQPGDLRAPRRPLPRREHVVAAPRGRVRTRRAARRPHHDRGRAALRRLARRSTGRSASACSPRSSSTCGGSSSRCRS